MSTIEDGSLHYGIEHNCIDRLNYLSSSETKICGRLHYDNSKDNVGRKIKYFHEKDRNIVLY